ncbi:MAG: 4Fe-4S dicluster-binding protein [Dehalococcoidia bacterium]
MAFKIELAPCINCGWCRRSCPTTCIEYFATGRRTHVITPRDCIDCGICANVCPVDCIHPDPTYSHEPIELEAAREKARGWAKNRRQRKLHMLDAVETRVEAGRDA